MAVRYAEGIEVRRERDPWRDILIGIAAGVAGTAVMDRFHALVADLEGGSGDGGDGRGEGTADEEANGGTGEGEAAPGGEETHPLDDVALVGPFHRPGESAPETVGRVLYASVHDHEPDADTRRALATRVHWAQGMAMGGAYGLVRGAGGPGLDLAGGALFGAAVWLLADEVAVPVLGLAEGPTAGEPADHARALAAHVAYGVATAAAARILDRMT